MRVAFSPDGKTLAVGLHRRSGAVGRGRREWSRDGSTGRD